MTRKILAAVTLCVLAVCAIARVQAQGSSGAQTTPTFSKDVAPILYKNCTNCHRPGEIGPMSLLSYQDARPWAKSIATRVAAGTMPPWHADPTYGEFSNDRRLSEKDRAVILAWASQGAPEGNPQDLPSAPQYTDGWQLGKPDAVFAMGEDYPVPPSGTIEYKYFEVPTNFTEDKFVQAFEVRPGDRSVVHHVIVFARQPPKPAPAGEAKQGEAKPKPKPPIEFAPGMDIPKDEEVAAAKRAPANDRPEPKGNPGAFVAAFAPGQAVRVYQEGTAIRIPAGATLIFQMHYTASGKATTDRTKIGMTFAKAKPRQEVIVAALLNGNFTLPAGSPDTRVDAQMTLNRDMTVWSILPHTHVRGKRWQVAATYPDGHTEMLLAVPRYDFNWQTDYVYKQPLKLPAGTKVTTSAWYDNSAANKSNPDPTADVHWGDQTWQEMQFTAFAFTIDPQPATNTGPSRD
jgi:hypothetical protein